MMEYSMRGLHGNRFTVKNNGPVRYVCYFLMEKSDGIKYIEEGMEVCVGSAEYLLRSALVKSGSATDGYR
jgi:hypothetical protein